MRASLLAALGFVLPLVGAVPEIALAAPGDIDPTFGSGGRVVTDIVGGDDNGVDALLQPDGKVVVGGTTVFAGTHFFLVLRYLTDGALDPSFGLASGSTTTSFNSGNSDLGALTRQADGKLVAAGSAQAGSGSDFALARYDADGVPDPTFGVNGLVRTSLSASTERANGVLVQPDGKIVAAGNAGPAIALARYETDGSLDPSFGTGGTVTAAFPGGFAAANAVVREADGKLVVAGSGIVSGNAQFLLARFLDDGSLDGTFGTAGFVTTDFGGSPFGMFAQALVIQPDGKLVAAGRGPDEIDTLIDAGVARYESDGSLDASFGVGGLVHIDFVASSNDAAALTLQSDGALIVGGFTYDVNGEHRNFALARLLPDGRPDGAFGAHGEVVTDVEGGNDAVQAVLVQADGKVVAIGTANTDSFDNFDGDVALVRYDGFALPCSPAPLTGCHAAAAPRGSKLALKTAANPSGDRLKWRWKGAATTLTELGDPRTSDDYVLCAYDGSGVRFSVLAAAGGSCGNAPCWSAVATRGYVYKDALLTPLGLQKLLLKSGGDGKALALAAGKGANLPAFGQPLPLPLRVQLQAKNGSCWDATYSAAGLKRNDAAQFSATSD